MIILQLSSAIRQSSPWPGKPQRGPKDTTPVWSIASAAQLLQQWKGGASENEPKCNRTPSGVLFRVPIQVLRSLNSAGSSARNKATSQAYIRGYEGWPDSSTKCLKRPLFVYMQGRTEVIQGNTAYCMGIGCITPGQRAYLKTHTVRRIPLYYGCRPLHLR